MSLLSLKNVSLSFGGLPLLDGVELNIERGERVCLLGANGTGKSSMLRVLAGETQPDSGQVSVASGITVARLPQQVPSHLEGRVLDIVCPNHDEDIDSDLLLSARQIMSRLSLDPAASFASLSGGTRRRVLLARTLLGEPDIVLLDEPTNHLDIDSITWLETFLLRHCKTFLFVTHDRAFLRRLASRVIELDRGRLNNWNCDYDTFLRRKEEWLQAEEKQWAGLDKKLAKEEEWIRRGVKARTTRNQGRVHALETLRAERARRRERAGSVQINIQEAERTGRVVLKADDISFGYDGAFLIRNFSTTLMRGSRVGILGPNGCGKTTLLRLLLEPVGLEGSLVPQAGKVVHGTNLQVAYSDQLRARLDDDKTLADNIADGREFVMINGARRHIYGYLEDFLFSPDRARQPVRSLSGGERNRVLLARLFAEPSNVLVLDEPTNDLDYDTLALLEEQISLYNGTVLVVSHDRSFLDNVVTSVLAFEKHPPGRGDVWLGPADGWHVNEYVGGYDDWAAGRIMPPEPEPPEKKVGPKPPRERAPKKRRLSEKEKRELAALPGQIEAFEAEQSQLNARMADPAFYRKGGEEVARARQRVEELISGLEIVYARWEELEKIAAESS
ncbi:MAG: ABC transporter ATP-binding protein [Verrucomicrobia bacterium]|nr:ABC transporter ATP-binding protein [Verrucomicrobiota bacterium]